MLKYTTNILELLKKAGYTTYKLRQNKLLGESAIQSLRQGKEISWSSLETICELLNCQPNDIIISITQEEK